MRAVNVSDQEPIFIRCRRAPKSLLCFYPMATGSGNGSGSHLYDGQIGPESERLLGCLIRSVDRFEGNGPVARHQA